MILGDSLTFPLAQPSVVQPIVQKDTILENMSYSWTPPSCYNINTVSKISHNLKVNRHIHTPQNKQMTSLALHLASPSHCIFIPTTGTSKIIIKSSECCSFWLWGLMITEVSRGCLQAFRFKSYFLAESGFSFPQIKSNVGRKAKFHHKWSQETTCTHWNAFWCQLLTAICRI